MVPILVFDIETIPDVAGIRALNGLPERDRSPPKVAAAVSTLPVWAKALASALGDGHSGLSVHKVAHRGRFDHWRLRCCREVR